MRRGRKWLLSNRSRNAAFIPAVAAIAAESARAHGKALQHAPEARGTRRRWQRRQRRLEGEEMRLPRTRYSVSMAVSGSKQEEGSSMRENLRARSRDLLFYPSAGLLSAP
jgi:hypothetical protein